MAISLDIFGCIAALGLCGAPALAQLAPNAPKDQPHVVTKDELAAHDEALAPYIKSALETYPAARARFLAGLPPGERFFLVTRVFDSQGHREQIFVRVRAIQEGIVSGVISSQIMAVSGFKAGQTYSFKESAIIDWLISKPDGSEEGNVVGKFLDTLK